MGRRRTEQQTARPQCSARHVSELSAWGLRVGAEPPESVCVGAGRGSWASKEGGVPAAQLRAQEPGLALPQCISVCLPICLNPFPPPSPRCGRGSSSARDPCPSAPQDHPSPTSCLSPVQCLPCGASALRARPGEPGKEWGLEGGPLRADDALEGLGAPYES